MNEKINNGKQMISSRLVPHAEIEVIENASPAELMARIRPQWQSRNLIARVHRLLNVDPSSACQRLLNAAIHDLHEKIAIAGIDIAKDAANKYKLPPITQYEDIERYPTSKLIDLAYRIGLLSRPEWRRVCRCYEIRSDLEHEDDEYEAGIEDCIYVFKTCIDVILSKDPITLVKVTDFRDLIEQATPAVPDGTLLEDYNKAPKPRQVEILKFLISKTLNREILDIVQQNAYTCISYLQPLTKSAVLVEIGSHLQEKAGRNIDQRTARIAEAIGVFAYLRQSSRCNFFERFYDEMENVGTHWSAYQEHGKLLRTFIEFGGLGHCPSPIRTKILEWLILAYLGVPGGVTRYGNTRHVFYSNSAAPLIEEIVTKSGNSIREELLTLAKSNAIVTALKNNHISRRLDRLLDLVDII